MLTKRIAKNKLERNSTISKKLMYNILDIFLTTHGDYHPGKYTINGYFILVLHAKINMKFIRKIIIFKR